jgi:hypothetical protein
MLRGLRWQRERVNGFRERAGRELHAFGRPLPCLFLCIKAWR